VCLNLLDGLYDGFPYPSGDRLCRSCSDSATDRDSSDRETTTIAQEYTPTISVRSMHADLTRITFRSVQLSVERAAFRRFYISRLSGHRDHDATCCRRENKFRTMSPSEPDGARVCCLDPYSINRGERRTFYYVTAVRT